MLGVRAYHVDAFTWAHVARGGPAHERFMARSLDERWVHADPVEMAEWFVDISRERMQMVVDDLAAVPCDTLTIVEGPQLLPELLPAGVRAVCLVATEAFRVRALGDRPLLPVADPRRARQNRLLRDLVLEQRIRWTARQRGLSVIEVDGTRGVEDVARAVEQALPPFTPARDVRAVRRWENEVVARQLELWLLSGEGPPEPPIYEYACECGRVGCCARVGLGLDAFRERLAAEDRVLAHA